VETVDLRRYAGEWFELARLPLWFQRHCVDSKARYSLLPDGRLGIHNECVTRDGTVESDDGAATVVDGSRGAKLRVWFDNWFARLIGPSRDGNYWILYIDPDYRTAIVGTPDRRHLWILARDPKLDEAQYARLVERAREFGYPVADLIRAKRSL
jgi:apolipoprotein D and lipocalin family protein